ncbi:N-lysine methyltransferase KMT5A-like [Pungitius pungitius]|uniref:N-lysine methyltransferase KMT5A-like n=1 Tax=Pungitius pungitius TaxID=134920 RepID=UPI002E1529CC
MAARRSRLLPVWDAIDYAAKGLDKNAELEVKYINSFKGRGVFAKAPFQKGDFVVEYRGVLISSEESQRRKSIYHARCSVFMFDFYCREKAWCVDAAQEDGSLGRLVNDDRYHPNCKMKKVITDGKPHLFLFALRDIAVGEEITYEYDGKYYPWRKQTLSSDSEVDLAEDESDSAPQRRRPQNQTEKDSSDSDLMW